VYKALNNFLFRTPYFPFSALLDFEKNQCESTFKEMLQIATPDLSEAIEKGSDKAQYSAYRYFQRACTRPTPFGLFAGCSVGTVGEHTEIQLSEQTKYMRNTRLDMNYICALIQQLEKNRYIREQLQYYPNSSMYSVGNHLRYVEYYLRKMRRVHQIKQVENSEYLKRVLSLARSGAQFSELVATLVDDEITTEESAEYIHELINFQVFISELEPSVTNIHPLKVLISKLNKLPNVNQQLINILTEINEQLSGIDLQPIGITCDIYPSIINNIKQTETETESKYLFQTDMFKPAQQAIVSRNIIRDIQQALLFLNKLTAPPASTNLSRFIEIFYNRYEEREMPLLFALDNELGIGYADNTAGDVNPLLDDLTLPHGKLQVNVPQIPIQSVLLNKYQQSQQKIIELIDEDIIGVDAKWDDLPPTFSVVCQILQDDDHGRSVFIQSVGGQSAAKIVGRFCHLNEQILNHTLVITKKEEQLIPDVIFAEIVHLPESRIGNILLRPVLRPYEISYLAKSGVSGEFEIRPDDLYISVKNNRIVLRSKRLNKEIVPRMSNAHNFSGQNSMPVYHFLCDLQHQNGRTVLGFFLNETVQQLDYFPRVVYKNCILSQARWTVREQETKMFVGIKDNDELMKKIKGWQHVRNIPDTVLLADGDNELYIDFNHPSSIRAWLSAVKKRTSFRLVEFLFDPLKAVVCGPEGVFTNEFIIAFYRENQ